MLEISEYLLEFDVTSIETSSLRLKMATLSTLSACYWRQAKFVDSINCMNSELKLASYLNNQAADKSMPAEGGNQVYLGNIYRIYGNLASAYQRLNRLSECLEHFQHQLEVSLSMNDTLLTINTNNSIGLAYNKLKNYSKSLEYFENSLELIQAYEDQTVGKKLLLNQFNLIGECCLKLSVYEKAREYFIKQLELSCSLNEEATLDKATTSSDPPENDSSKTNCWMQECLAIFSLALISSKLKDYTESNAYYEACLAKLNTNDTGMENLSQQLLEIYGRVFIGLINNYLNLNDNARASLYAHSMLDFTLKEIDRLMEANSRCEPADTCQSRLLNKSFNSMNMNEEEEREEVAATHQKRFQYLKFIEMTACSKLATCYLRQNRLLDAFKLHQREATLAMYLNNTLYLTRAYSHMAQIYFHSKDYEKCIYLYKQILHTIELSLLDADNGECDKAAGFDESNNEQIDHKQDIGNNSISHKYNSIRDERLVQMIVSFNISFLNLKINSKDF